MRLISVTEALSPFADFSKVNPELLQYASDRGIEVHQACAAYPMSLPVFITERAAPYFKSFLSWFDSNVKKVLFVEREFIDPKVFFIKGHPDIVCELSDSSLVVIDYKTPQVESKLWQAQIAAYSYLVEQIMDRKPDGMALMLSANGGPARGIRYKYQAQDFAAFVAALQAYRAFRG